MPKKMKKMEKNVLRSTLIDQRKQHSNDLQQIKSHQIALQIIQSDCFKESQHIALYHAVRGEADPNFLGNDASKQFYLPILAKDKNVGLVFAPTNQDTHYVNNRFSIPEPVFEEEELRSANELDLIIMPLLGFDASGNRLGMGGGFYDRSLAFKRESPKRKPFLVGFAYNFQEINQIESEHWDIKLNAIATEDRFIPI